MEAQLQQHDIPNRRREQRMRVLKKGRLIFNHGFSAMDCIIRNISGGGALIDIPSVIGLPDNFELAIGPELHGRICRVVWRADHLAGVCYN